MNYYHGSPHRKDGKAFGSPGNKVPTIAPGRPFFVTECLSFAAHFARGGLVTEVETHLGAIADLQCPELLERLLGIFNADPAVIARSGQWDEDVDGDVADSSYFLLESADVTNALLAEGFTAALCIEDVERGTTSIAILDPSAVLGVRVIRSGQSVAT